MTSSQAPTSAAPSYPTAGVVWVIQPENGEGPSPLPPPLSHSVTGLRPHSFHPRHLHFTDQKPEAPELPGTRPRARLPSTGSPTRPGPSGDRDSTLLET